MPVTTEKLNALECKRAHPPFTEITSLNRLRFWSAKGQTEMIRGCAQTLNARTREIASKGKPAERTISAMDKAAFMRQHGRDYGYGLRTTDALDQEPTELEIDALRREEFAQLQGMTTVL